MFTVYICYLYLFFSAPRISLLDWWRYINVFFIIIIIIVISVIISVIIIIIIIMQMWCLQKGTQFQHLWVKSDLILDQFIILAIILGNWRFFPKPFYKFDIFLKKND